MSVRETFERIDAEEMAHWIALDRIEPWSGRRIDILLAQLCAIVASAHSAKGKRPSVRDFVPDWWARPQTPEDVAAQIRQAFGSRASGRK